MDAIDAFLSSATLDIVLRPGVGTSLGTEMARVMLEEVKKHGSTWAQVHVISRDDHLSISIEDVELPEMTPAAYGVMLQQLQEIAKRMASGSR